MVSDEVRATLIDHSDLETRRHLAQVCHSFRASLRRPSRWAQHYGPALLDADNNTIYTGWCPTSRGSVSDAHRRPSPAKPRLLGTFENAAWTLRFDGPTAPPEDPALLALLDQVSEVTYQGFFELNLGAPGRPQRVVENQPHAYAFLRDRAYRLAHGLPIPTYSLKAQLWMASVVVSFMSLGALAYTSYQARDHGEGAFEGNSAFQFWAAAGASYYALLMVYFGAECAGMWGLRNLWDARKNAHRLNTWCMEFQRNEGWAHPSLPRPVAFVAPQNHGALETTQETVLAGEWPGANA